MNKEEILGNVFGYSSFRYPQDLMIDTILNHQDCIGILPTGSGKSLIFQIPGIILPGISIIVSPLISLMCDQVTVLNRKNVSACMLNSNLSKGEEKMTYNRIRSGEVKIIYTTPERLLNKSFIELMKDIPLSMLAIDEAHTLLWGIDFRSAFLRIHEFVNLFRTRPVIVAVSATANEKTIAYIKSSLVMRKPILFKTTFDRSNLFYRVVKTKDKLSFLQTYISKHLDETGIIYALTKKSVEELSRLLNNQGIKTSFYHGGLPVEVKNKNQMLFLSKKIKLMVATISFGMGIDLSSIRYVINYEMPMSISDLVQMAGRCSRDGKYGECILLYDKSDLKKNYFLAKEGVKDKPLLARLRILNNKYFEISKVVEYALSTKCLHQFICEYYNEKKKPCRNICSNCYKI